jgi:hypothetical protein
MSICFELNKLSTLNPKKKNMMMICHGFDELLKISLKFLIFNFFFGVEIMGQLWV